MTTSVALVGSLQQDNLSIGYLASAAEAAGFSAQLVPYTAKIDLQRCVSDILVSSPSAVGISIPFQYAAADVVALVEALRRAGYAGHITCGGHVPTFCYEALLSAAPGLDTAVRHEGEETLVEMLQALDTGASVENLRGLVWREGSEIVAGPPRRLIRDLDALPFPKRGEAPFEISGMPIGFVIASRGCIGECAYCSIRAFTQDAGGPGLRLRRPETVAEEIAGLYFDRGVRVAFLEDDLFIMPNAAKTVARMDALKAALDRLGVGPMLFWVKARPESITKEVLDAAKRLGVGHVFLGVEQASDARLAYLGRVHTHSDNLRALVLLRQYDIKPSFNLMMFDPECTLEEAETAIAFAATQPDIPWNICRTEIYPGTRLYDRLRDERRLEGDALSCGYRMTDDRAERMFRILRVAFEHRAFHFDALLNRLSTLVFTIEAHRRLRPSDKTSALVQDAYRLVRAVNTETARDLQAVADFAKTSASTERRALQDFAVETAFGINEADFAYRGEIDRILAALR